MDIARWDLDIDHWLNRCIPRNQLHKLPQPVSRFLGHRNAPYNDVGNVLVAFWAFVGAFAGVAIIAAVLMIPQIHELGVPIVIASFGAAAILEYNVISSPLAQPRNSIIGHSLSALVGICVTKLFMLNEDFERLRWLAGAFSCGLASAVMTLTKTVYPPAGATALLAAVDPMVSGLGWFLLPLVLLSAILTLVSSLLLNNIQRRWPVYWWTSADLVRTAPQSDIEKIPPSEARSSMTAITPHEDESDHCVRVYPDATFVSERMTLTGEEIAVLAKLMNRLKDTAPYSSKPI